MELKASVEFGYWPIKGLGEVSRWVLAYTQIFYDEYEAGEDWNEVKNTLGFPFPNLPFLKHGDFKLTESRAIPAYVAQTFGKPELMGKDVKDAAIVQELIGVLGDVKQAYYKGIFTSEERKPLLEKIHKDPLVLGKLSNLEKFLDGKDFFLGYPTLADFEVAYTVYAFKVYAASVGVENILDNYPGLKNLWNTVTALEGVKQHIASSRFKRHLHTPSYIKMELKEEYSPS